MLKKITVLFFTILTVSSTLYGQHKVVQIYTGAAPGSENWNWEEGIDNNNAWKTQVAYNVTKPSLTIFTPDSAVANGTALIICPGGGFLALLMGNEGYDEANWLVKKGVTCFVLKYRLAHINTTNPVQYFNDAVHGGDKEKQKQQMDDVPYSIADGKAAIAYVRAHAKEFNIDSNKIGIMGFSAGGTVAAAAAFNYTRENKPNFVVPVYAFFPKAMQGTVAEDAPPMFIAVAANDPLNLQSHSIDLFTAWNTAKKDVELHVYNQGGHGFGMRVQHVTSDTWIERLAEWLAVKKLIK
ncbi:MAG: alpha/beta hydrolase [Bacteroidetes bacterium]|nr:alpha/beta hydrolase [Bacteroidota bacterium]